MHEDGIVAEASERLQMAELIPPVQGVVWQGDEGEADEVQPWIAIDVTGPVSAELEAKLSEVLQSLAYKVQSVPPGGGVVYGGGPEHGQTD